MCAKRAISNQNHATEGSLSLVVVVA